MEILKYSIEINVSREKVWKTMLHSERYKEWAKAFSSDSQFLGEWKKGSHIKFIDPQMGGTKALIEVIRPFDYIHVKHVAIIDKDGREDTESDTAKTWLGITETYILDEVNDKTELSVNIQTHKDYVKMFNDCWPTALQLLKNICENQ